jgi:hypothetical protein
MKNKSRPFLGGRLWKLVGGCGVGFHMPGLPYLERDYELGSGGNSGFTWIVLPLRDSTRLTLINQWLLVFPIMRHASGRLAHLNLLVIIFSNLSPSLLSVNKYWILSAEEGLIR